MKLARIDVFSHGMRLSGYGLRFAHLIGHYLRDRCLHLRKRRDPRTRRMVTDTINTYAAARSDYSEVYLLREQLKSFLDFIFSRGIRKEWLEIVYHDPVPGKEVEFVKKWKFPWREDQQEWLEYMDGGKDTPFRMSLNTAQTGSGKTAMSQEITFRRGVRTGIILSPRYMPGWRSSLLNFFGMEPGDVIEIRGNAKEDPPHPDIPRYSMLEFQTLVEQGELDFKIALFSLNMFQRYIADYEKNNCVAPYAFHPAEFWEKTGIGLLIHDECHEALHFLFKVKCYANIPEIIYLSATAVSDDPFIEQMLYLMYPKEARYAKGEYKKYIAVNAVTYRLRSTDKVRYKGFGGAYSHTIFEQSIMKNKQLKLAYFNFIYTVIIKGFMNQYQEGMKMLVYCATVDMCKSLSHYLSERIPELEIGPYTAEEDFMVLLDNDISVTTVKSAGTGIDLPDLVMTFMTLAMGSRTGNIQVLGRLRQLKGKFEGMTPTFWYLVCTSIEAHRKYHQRKVEFFSDKVLTQRVIDEDFEL
ncbi:hypothetical protein MOQ33_00870 [Escherichia coli]|uniref:hypothetical protein n=1 Tax=Escherichia coli TaxID=562 RepID=UPI0021472490|nr:hypothetical protein [Escherichia coli]MCR1105839.1 hypothetical protein [Escherichia coli]MDT9424411.1 hypothetical protein [Escherichia coli]